MTSRLGSAKIQSNGAVHPLDRRPPPNTQVTKEDVADPARLALVLTRLNTKAADHDARWQPRHIDVEDQVVDGTGTTLYRLRHGFNGRVRYWPVDWQPNALNAACILQRHASTDNNTLVLVSGNAGTVTIRVEEAG